MRPLTPFSGGLFQLAFTTASAVDVVAAALMLADRLARRGAAGIRRRTLAELQIHAAQCMPLKQSLR